MSKKDFDIDVQYLHTTMEKLKEAFAANEDIIANIQLSTVALESLKKNNFESLYDKVKTLTVIYTFIFSIIPKNINPENKKDFKRLLRSGVVEFFKNTLINIYEYDTSFKHEDSAERLNSFIDAQTDFNSKNDEINDKYRWYA